MSAPRLCDFCGRFEPLTIEAKETARVICSACVWQCAELLVGSSKIQAAFDRDDALEMPHAARCTT